MTIGYGGGRIAAYVEKVDEGATDIETEAGERRGEGEGEDKQISCGVLLFIHP